MENKTIYVWATDKFLSGWGCAEGKIHKQVASLRELAGGQQDA